MKRLFNLLRQRQGMTLTEVMCAGFLLVIFIEMCAAALSPAAKTAWRLRQVSEAQIVADSILESVRAEVEEAREYIRVCQYDGGDGVEWMDSALCADEGTALEFVNSNGRTMLISAGSGVDPAGFGRLLYRYYVTDSGDGGDTFQKEETPETGAGGAVFPEAFYTGLYLKLRFSPVLEDGMLMRVKITAQLGKRLENTGEGPTVEDIICTESVIAGLRHAVELRNGVRVKTGLPFNPVTSEKEPLK